MSLLEKIPETKEPTVDGEMLAIDEQASIADADDSARSEEERKEDYAEQQIPQTTETLPDRSSEEELSARNSKAKPDVDDV